MFLGVSREQLLNLILQFDDHKFITCRRPCSGLHGSRRVLHESAYFGELFLECISFRLRIAQRLLGILVIAVHRARRLWQQISILPLEFRETQFRRFKLVAISLVLVLEKFLRRVHVAPAFPKIALDENRYKGLNHVARAFRITMFETDRKKVRLG